MAPLPQDGIVLSGADCTLAFSGQAFSFSHEDLARRAVVAGVELGLVGAAASGDPRVHRDFADLVLGGELTVPESRSGSAALALAAGTVPGGRAELVYWLRKLVFRGAWIDARVADGRIEATYDERSASFSYAAGGLELAPSRRDDLPAWSVRPSDRPRTS
jgi:hypothetical protein